MKSFVSTDPNTHQGDNTWFTPKHIIDSLGPFDMDVCTVSTRPFDTATEHIEYDKGECGLALGWFGYVWMNPPYGKEIEPFIKKFGQHENGIALVFARMGTPWMQEWISKGRDVFFLRKRVKFINRYGITGSNAGTDSCLLVCGSHAKDQVNKSGLEWVWK